ncbi:putative transport protein MmpL1 [Dissostichus eleginoides]|uniref:Transport protein MmpL1 n=1 Tax=Dissostichus eleginoides TaxID=100907 RepID=A0AAD9CEI1_DISEL|nr:putative transport protein MmpL1 [Dissostichus eleginoides]
MMEVPGNNGPMLVFRPWSDRDIDEAMHHVNSPTDNCQRFETTFRQFVGEYRPNMLEVRRLMAKLLKEKFHKISRVFTMERMGQRLTALDYDDAVNRDYQEKALWSKSRAVFKNQEWVGPDNKPCLPRALFHCYAKLAHSRDHEYPAALLCM